MPRPKVSAKSKIFGESLATAVFAKSRGHGGTKSVVYKQITQDELAALLAAAHGAGMRENIGGVVESLRVAADASGYSLKPPLLEEIKTRMVKENWR